MKNPKTLNPDSQHRPIVGGFNWEEIEEKFSTNSFLFEREIVFFSHSEDVVDLERACEIIDMAISAYPNFNLFKGVNKQAVD